MIRNLTEFWRLTRELDVSAIRAEFERGAHVQVLGADRALAERVAALIDPSGRATEVSVSGLDTWEEAGRGRSDEPDVSLVAIGRTLDPAARRALTELSADERRLVLIRADESSEVLILGVPEERVVNLPPDLPEAAARARLVRAMATVSPYVLLPLGRRFPGVRETVVDDLIRETARVNAQFAAVASLPSTVPLLGGLVGDVADILVLTKNQIILLFKLAGLYGRDLELGQRQLMEIMPVVGGALFWRTTARTLVGLLPAPLGLLPKTVVAFTGTMVVGEIARYYYQFGRKPPPELVSQLRADAARLAQDTLARLRPGSK